MRKKQMVGTRLPAELLNDLVMIERQDQTDRSTTIRNLLRRAVADWKREHDAREGVAAGVDAGYHASEQGYRLGKRNGA